MTPLHNTDNAQPMNHHEIFLEAANLFYKNEF